MTSLLALLISLLSHRPDAALPEQVAGAIWVASQHRPRPPGEWARLMVAIGENESGFSLRIINGNCDLKKRECDNGRAKGAFQIHRNAFNRDSWAMQDGDLALQAQLASDQLERAYWQCHKSGVPWLEGTIRAYAGVGCRSEWSGLKRRVDVYRRLR